MDFSQWPRLKCPQDTALVVNSHFETRKAMQDFLGADSYQLLFANDKDEAVELCRNYAGPIHLLITDDESPATCGWELAEMASKIRPGLIVLFLSKDNIVSETGHTDRSDVSAHVLLQVTQALAHRELHARN